MASQSDPNRMTFLEHLDELRRRLFYALLSIAVLCIVGWLVREPVLELLIRPVQENLPEGFKPVYITLAEPFLLAVKVALFTGLVLATPVVLWQVWLFISPGLYRKERRYAFPFLFSGTVSFFAGAWFGYEVVFPAAAHFLIDFGGDRFDPMLTIGRVFGFETRLILAMGVVFELPVVIFLLSRLGVVTPGFLWRNFKYAILIIFILAAVLTPTPDAATMTLVAGPMVALYLVGLLVSLLFGKPRRRSDGEDDEDDADDSDTKGEHS